MWIINRAEFEDISNLAKMLIIKEFAQFSDSLANQGSLPLEAEGEKYGYTVYPMLFREKKYVFAFRDFHFTPREPLPQVP